MHLLVFMMFIINGEFTGCGKYCCLNLKMQDIAAYIFLDIYGYAFQNKGIRKEHSHEHL